VLELEKRVHIYVCEIEYVREIGMRIYYGNVM